MDSGVNVGPDRATKWLQTALNAFNGSYRTPPSWPEIAVDGRIGPGTIGALTAMVTLRGVRDTNTVLLRALNAQQGAHYLSISATSPKNEAFTFGWFLNRVS
jgi:lysozyme family protein